MQGKEIYGGDVGFYVGGSEPQNISQMEWMAVKLSEKWEKHRVQLSEPNTRFNSLQIQHRHRIQRVPTEPGEQVGPWYKYI